MFKGCSWQRKVDIVNSTLICNLTLIQLAINGDYSAPNQIAWCLNSMIVFCFILIVCIYIGLFFQSFGVFFSLFFCPKM